MTIKERNEKIAQHADLVALGGGKGLKKKTLDVAKYWNTLQKPPIRAYIQDWVIQRLYDYMTSPRLINNPARRFKLTNELLLPWGFKPLASGTNRRAFYCEYDPTIIFKIASDAVGQKDNQSELYIQQLLRPFCPKVFNVDGDGVIALTERGEPMTEHDYKFVWAEEIFDLLFSLLARGYILEDVGSNFYKNFGIRLGFGPMIWDFPYVYKLDWRKLICQKPDRITGEPCGGEIDYDYNKGMSEIICTRCGARYSAKYLASSVPSEAINMVNRERGITMGRFDTNFQVYVRQGDKIVTSYSNETSAQRMVDNRSNRRTLDNGEPLPAHVANNGIVTETAAIPTVQQNNFVQNVAQQTNNNNVSNNYYGEGTTVSITNTEKNDQVQNVIATYGPQTENHAQYTIAHPSGPIQAQPVPAVNNGIVLNQTPQQQFTTQSKRHVVNFNAQKIVQQQPAVQEPPKPAPPKRAIVKANGQTGITLTPEEFIALIANCQAAGTEVPIALIQAAPELYAGMMQNHPEPENMKPLNTVGPIKEYTHYYENGVRYFYYPSMVKNRIVQWLIDMRDKFGIEVANTLAEKLEIKFEAHKKGKPSNPPPQSQQPATEVQTAPKIYPKIMPNDRNRVIAQTAANNPTINTLVQKPATKTIIAPKPEKKVLNVEQDWKTRAPIQTVENNPATNTAVNTQQPVQTTNLFPVKPMTREEKDAEDAKANTDGAILGFPGVSMVEILRFDEDMPRIKAAVEQRFSHLILNSEDADKQVTELSRAIKDFIAGDVAAIMGTDQNGIEVIVGRTTDHRNKDCFSVQAFNYKTPLFITVLYPADKEADQLLMNDTVQQQSVQVQEPEKRDLTEAEYVAVFGPAVDAFNGSNYKNFDETRHALVGYLVTKLSEKYHDDLTVNLSMGRIWKAANEYVDRVVSIEDTSNASTDTASTQVIQPKQPEVVTNPTYADSVGAAL